MKRFGLFAASIAALASGAAPAQNLIANPDFDVGIEGWAADVPWIDGSFDAEDWVGAPGSGSLRVTNTREIVGEEGVSQCVPVPEQDGTQVWDVYVQARVGDGQYLTGAVVFGVWFYSGSACDESQLTNIAPTHQVETWNELGFRGFVMAAATRSVLIDLRANKYADVPSFDAHFDHAYLPEPSALGSTSAAVLALVRLRRRR